MSQKPNNNSTVQTPPRSARRSNNGFSSPQSTDRLMCMQHSHSALSLQDVDFDHLPSERTSVAVKTPPPRNTQTNVSNEPVSPTTKTNEGRQKPFIKKLSYDQLSAALGSGVQQEPASDLLPSTAAASQQGSGRWAAVRKNSVKFAPDSAACSEHHSTQPLTTRPKSAEGQLEAVSHLAPTTKKQPLTSLQSWRGGATAVQDHLQEVVAQNWLFYVLLWLDILARGFSQVYLVSNPIAGVLIVVGLVGSGINAGVHAGWHAVFALVGASASTFGGVYAHHWQLTDEIKAGLFGYDGVLVGAALSTFLHVHSADTIWRGLLLVALVGFACGVMRKALGVLCGRLKIPAFTFCFNFTTMLVLHSVRNGNLRLDTPTGRPLLEEIAPSDHGAALFWMELVLNGVGQLTFVDTWFGSLLVVVGLLWADLAVGAAAVFGGLVGSSSVFCMGGITTVSPATLSKLRYGLFGYNSCATAIVAVSIIDAPSRMHRLTTVVFGSIFAAFATDSLAATTSLPIMTIPFVVSGWLLVLSQQGSPGTAREALEGAGTKNAVELLQSNPKEALFSSVPVQLSQKNVEMHNEAHEIAGVAATVDPVQFSQPDGVQPPQLVQQELVGVGDKLVEDGHV